MPTTPETDPAAFAERLREALESAGHPERGAGATLSRKYKVAGPTAHGWLTGKHLPTTVRVRNMARDFDVSFDWLMFGKGPKHLKGARELGAVEVFSSDHFEVPQHSVSGSMGGGAFVADHIDVVRNISVSLSQLRRQVSFSAPENLSFMTGYGPSMEPTFFDGDILLVDRGIASVDIDAVYVLVLNDRLYIKTLQRRPDGFILMISDNKRYEPYTITEKDTFEIQGRVILAWNARRL